MSNFLIHSFSLDSRVAFGCNFYDNDTVISAKVMVGLGKVSVDWTVGFGSCSISVVVDPQMQWFACLSSVQFVASGTFDAIDDVLCFAVETLGEGESL